MPNVPGYESLVSSVPAKEAAAKETLVNPKIPRKKVWTAAKAELEKAGNPPNLLKIMAYAEAKHEEDEAGEAVVAKINEQLKPDKKLGVWGERKAFNLWHVHRHAEAAVPPVADVIPSRARFGQQEAASSSASSSSSPPPSSSSASSTSASSSSASSTSTLPSSPSSSSPRPMAPLRSSRRLASAGSAPSQARSTKSASTPPPDTSNTPTTTTTISPPDDWKDVTTYGGVYRQTDGVGGDHDVDYMQSLVDLVEASAPEMPEIPPRIKMVIIMRSGSGIVGVEGLRVEKGKVVGGHKIFGADISVLDGLNRVYVPGKDDTDCTMNGLAEIFWSSRAEYIILGQDKGKGFGRGQGKFSVFKMQHFLDQVIGKEPQVGSFWRGERRGETRRLLKAGAEAYDADRGDKRHFHLPPEGTIWESESSETVAAGSKRKRQICVPVDQGEWELTRTTFDRTVRLEVRTLAAGEEEDAAARKARRIESRGIFSLYGTERGKGGGRSRAAAAGSGAGKRAPRSSGGGGGKAGGGGESKGREGGAKHGVAQKASSLRRVLDRESDECPLGCKKCGGIPLEERMSSKLDDELLAEHYMKEHKGENLCPGCETCGGFRFVGKTYEVVLAHIREAHRR